MINQSLMTTEYLVKASAQVPSWPQLVPVGEGVFGSLLSFMKESVAHLDIV